MSSTRQLKEPSQGWLHSFLIPSLVNAKGFALADSPHRIKLDQNEGSSDWPEEFKDEVLAIVKKQSWQRYPSPYSSRARELLAEYSNVESKNVLVGPGSNLLITLLLSTFGRNAEGGVWLAEPSFPLYRSHCVYEGIPCRPWSLTEDFCYDPATLESLKPSSMVVFASPNNPTGTVLRKDDLQSLLQAHPQTLFLADEAYFEYASEPYTDLLQEFGNLLIIRTISKSMAAAGLRVGYVLGHESYIEELMKVEVPFLLNHFALAGIEVALTNRNLQGHFRNQVETTIAERNKMADSLRSSDPSQSVVKVYNTEANFLLLQWRDENTREASYRCLLDEGILVRDISRGPQLERCLRVTIGTSAENQAVIDTLTAFVASC